MNGTHKSRLLLLLTMLFMLICLPLAAFGQTEESNTQELTISNMPIKGRIVLNKQGQLLKGFEATTDSLGYAVHKPLYENGFLAGAVFEVRAAEEIIGRDGTSWFAANEVAATITTSASGADATPALPLGRYYLTEVSAPAGYILEPTRYDVTLAAADNQTAVVETTVQASNDYLPTEISLTKEKEVVSTLTDEDGMVSSSLTTAAGEGFVFGLYNSEAISYGEEALAAQTLITTAISDADGKLTFAQMLPLGEYYIQELSAPAGWKVSEAKHPIHISEEARTEDNIIRIALEKPVINELIRADMSITKMDITGSNYVAGSKIEVSNAMGEIILSTYTGKDGKTPAFPAIPGDYTFREVIAPEGYELCVTELSFTVNEGGEVEGQTVVKDDYNRFSILKVNEKHEPLAGVAFGLYREDETLVCTAVSDENGFAVFEKIPYGSYFIQEMTPLPGYLRDYTRIPVTIDGSYVNPTKPLATITNCPSEITINKVDQNGAALSGAKFGLYDVKNKLVMTADSDDEGTVRFTHVEYGSYTIREIAAPEGYLLNTQTIPVTIGEGYTNPDKPIAAITNHLKQIMCLKVNTSGTPLPGVEFSLINARTGKVTQVARSNKDGAFVFTNFDYGEWIIRETAAPDGYCRMEDKHFTVGADWKAPEPILCVNIPNHYEFLKTDASGTPLVGVKFRLEDEAGTNLGTYVSGSDGIVRLTNLAQGVYYIKEIETLEGFSLTGEVLKVSINEQYVIADQMKKLVNYTIIQTGVNLAITTVMWVGLGMMAASGILNLMLRRHKKKKQ